jgi:ketosteroid isomerase-like protein
VSGLPAAKRRSASKPKRNPKGEHAMSNGGDPTANLALVQRMYECFNRGDLDTIRNEIFARDLVWTLPGRHPLSGTKHGAEEVLAFFAELRRANIQVTLDPQNDPATGIDTFGSDIVVEVHRGRGTVNVRDTDGNETAVVLNALNCTHYRIAGGRIAQVQVYMSDQAAADNFFWAVYQLKPIPERLA